MWFQCNEKYAPCHHCKTMTLKLLECNDLEKENENETYLVAQAPSTLVEISFNVISNKDACPTTQLQGTLQVHKILILVDGEATRSFIFEQLVKTLKLYVKRISTFGEINSDQILHHN